MAGVVPPGWSPPPQWPMMAPPVASKGSGGMIILFIVCCICIIIGAVVAVYFGNVACSMGFGSNCPTSSVDNSQTLSDTSILSLPLSPMPSPAPGPAPAPATDPRQVVWSSGQSIQSAPLDISTQTIPFTNAPSGINTSQPPSYTMSMDINIAQTGPSWRNIFNNGAHDCCDATSRRPAMFITGTDAAPANRIHIVHGANEDNNRNIVSNFTATLGQWFNVTWVVNNGTMSTYFNGVPDATATGTFNWGSPVQNQWRWNEYIQEYTTRAENTQGSVQVANVYWWNTALTSTQISQLTVPSTPTSGVATTSYYMPEPFTRNNDMFAGYFKE